MNGCNLNIKTLKPSMTKQVFFSFFLPMVTVLHLNKIMKFCKIRGILYIKEENFDCNMLLGKNNDYIFVVHGLEK